MEDSLDDLLQMEENNRAVYLFFKAARSRKRLPREHEEFIKIYPMLAYEYADGIINDRWPEAEPYIFRDPEATTYYLEFLMDKYPDKVKITIDIIECKDEKN